ncbi:MAG: methionine--tRNA ligase [Phycisphaera sp.]|nr:methionine--tRNA ligase [Phycisphaera sp.]
MTNDAGQPYYITTPIYYVNDRPHIGHVYTTTVADILARYHRLKGDDVFFLTGVDEHAAKVVDAAATRGLTPQQWADQNAQVFKETFKRLGISNNDFVRTSEDRHKNKVREYVAALVASGDVYPGQYEGWYDAGQEEYVTDAKAQEYQYKSPINGKPLVRKQETNYFFRLEKYRDAVIEAIQSERFTVQPEARKNEIVNRLAEARDVPISRSGTGGWGIAMPDVPGSDPSQSIYVWIDALFNYLTYVDTAERRKYWTSGGGATHLIAKDILWFHAAIWPAMLLALSKCKGYEWVRLPGGVYAHSFWISEGMKMGKTLGNFIDLEKIDHYVETFSLDALRYFLATQGPMGTTDSDFAEAKFVETYNTGLANSIGNCFSRVSNMTQKYFNGVLPSTKSTFELPESNSISQLEHVRIRINQTSAFFDKMDLSAACISAKQLIELLDELIENTEPFKLAKDINRLPDVGVILNHCAEALRIASVLLWPVMPWKCEELWRRMGLSYQPGRDKLDDLVKWGQLQPGSKIEKGDALFMRYQAPK